MEYKPDGTTDTCTSRFRSDVLYTEINYWILGMPTYRNWEIAHDWEYQRIGFTPTSKSRAYKYVFVDNQLDNSAGSINGVSSSPPEPLLDNSTLQRIIRKTTKSLKYILGFYH